MDYITNTSELMNYEIPSSNSNNYGIVQQSPSPTSFPSLMENGILVKYELVRFSTEIVDETKLSNE